MNGYEKAVLERLLDKYEARQKGSNRRVRIVFEREKGIAPDIESEEYHDFRESMENLKSHGIIDLDWITNRKSYIISSVWLVTENASEAYKMLGREDKSSIVSRTLKRISDTVESIKKGWVQEYLEREKERIISSEKVTGIWSLEDRLTDGILKALKGIGDLNGESVSMRAFSVSLYGDSKFFEREIKNRIIPIIRANEPVLADSEDPGDREILAQVGIIMMPEVFEFCGNVRIHFQRGTVDFSPIKSGSCVSGDSVSEMKNIEIIGAERIIFIENKTNYSDYCLSHRSENELAVYHGGFLSPQRMRFFRLLCAEKNIPIYFWGDIDYGGFKMFSRLKKTVAPSLLPMNMDIKAFEDHKSVGLKKSEDYINKLIKLKEDKDYEMFYDVIDAIARDRTTVEQESFIDW